MLLPIALNISFKFLRKSKEEPVNQKNNAQTGRSVSVDDFEDVDGVDITFHASLCSSKEAKASKRKNAKKNTKHHQRMMVQDSDEASSDSSDFTKTEEESFVSRDDVVLKLSSPVFSSSARFTGILYFEDLSYFTVY